MNANEVIELYIEDVVRLLPRRQRQDVAVELGGLLNQELTARAQEWGRPADEQSALSLVRAYGRPSEAAARYHPAWTIVDPADSPSFLRAAIIGTLALQVLSVLKAPRPHALGAAADVDLLLILAWFGFLVLVFGFKSYIRRSRPSTAVWQPCDRDRTNRIGTAILVPAAALVVLFYSAPSWMLERASGGRIESSWAAYTAEFEQRRLPWFIAAIIALLAVRTFVAIQGRWSRLTRRLSIGLNAAVAALILSFAVDGNVFRSAEADRIAKSVLACVAVIYVSCVGVQIYGEMGRIEGGRGRVGQAQR
jgi:hypothetical protein